MEPICQHQPCNHSPIAKGLCRRHYEQARRRERGLTLRVVVTAATLAELERDGSDAAARASDILAAIVK